MMFKAEIHGDFSHRDQNDKKPEGIEIISENADSDDPMLTVAADDLKSLVAYCATFLERNFYIYQNGAVIAKGNSVYGGAGVYYPNIEYI